MELFNATIGFESYAPHINAPTLWLGATNDFHRIMDDTYRTGALGDKKAGPFKLEVEWIKAKESATVSAAMMMHRDIAYVDKKRITIIPAIHGKLTYDRKISEPDVYWIVEKWLERHPEIDNRKGRIRAVTGQWTTEDGLKTEVITVSIVAGDDLADYNPEQDADLYAYWKTEDRYWEAG